MKLFSLISSGLALPLVGAYLVAPDGTPAPGANSDCSAWVQQSYDLTCALIERVYGMTEAQFEAWNPTTAELGSNCTLLADFYYCVQVDYISYITTSAVASSAAVTATGASNNTSISSIIYTSSVSMPTTLVTMSISTADSDAPTTTSSIVTAPGPTQTGIISTCDLYAIPSSGTGCSDFATANNITTDELYLWNPAIGSCENFWSGEAYCVGVSN